MQANDKNVKALFIHRSVGQNMLDDTRLREQIKGIEFYDINANTSIYTMPGGEQQICPMKIENGSTEPTDITRFMTAMENQEFLSGFATIIVKSCYTSSAIRSDEQAEAQKQAYQSLIRYANARPRQQFIICLSPPRKRLFTDDRAITRVRDVHESVLALARGIDNVKMLDLLRLLGNEKGTLAKEFCRPWFYDMHPNAQGSIVFSSQLKAILVTW